MTLLKTSSPTLKFGLAIIAAILMIKYLVLPLHHQQQSWLGQAAKLQETVSRKQNLIGRQDDIETLNQISDTRLADLMTNFETRSLDPPALQLALQQRIEALAESLGAQVKNVDWLPPVSNPIIQAPVRFQMDVTPETLYKILHTLETAKPFIGIDRIELRAIPRNIYMSAKIDITAYAVALPGRKNNTENGASP